MLLRHIVRLRGIVLLWRHVIRLRCSALLRGCIVGLRRCALLRWSRTVLWRRSRVMFGGGALCEGGGGADWCCWPANTVRYTTLRLQASGSAHGGLAQTSPIARKNAHACRFRQPGSECSYRNSSSGSSVPSHSCSRTSMQNTVSSALIGRGIVVILVQRIQLLKHLLVLIERLKISHCRGRLLLRLFVSY